MFFRCCYLIGHVGLVERSSGHILGGDNGWGRERPFNADRGIVPEDGAFRGGRVKIGGFVNDVGALREDQESMSESRRDPKHLRDLRVELDRCPPPEMRGRSANIDSDVKNSSGNRSDQLSLGML